jgi:hypothetical protein
VPSFCLNTNHPFYSNSQITRTLLQNHIHITAILPFINDAAVANTDSVQAVVTAAAPVAQPKPLVLSALPSRHSQAAQLAISTRAHTQADAVQNRLASPSIASILVVISPASSLDHVANHQAASPNSSTHHRSCSLAPTATQA